MTSKLLQVNPEFYTVWNYRRNIFINGLFPQRRVPWKPSGIRLIGFSGDRRKSISFSWTTYQWRWLLSRPIQRSTGYGTIVSGASRIFRLVQVLLAKRTPTNGKSLLGRKTYLLSNRCLMWMQEIVSFCFDSEELSHIFYKFTLGITEDIFWLIHPMREHRNPSWYTLNRKLSPIFPTSVLGTSDPKYCHLCGQVESSMNQSPSKRVGAHLIMGLCHLL